MRYLINVTVEKIRLFRAGRKKMRKIKPFFQKSIFWARSIRLFTRLGPGFEPCHEVHLLGFVLNGLCLKSRRGNVSTCLCLVPFPTGSAPLWWSWTHQPRQGIGQMGIVKNRYSSNQISPLHWHIEMKSFYWTEGKLENRFSANHVAPMHWS